jgi:hypothetical protein
VGAVALLVREGPAAGRRLAAAEHPHLGHELDRADQLGRVGGEARVGRTAGLAERGQRPGVQRPDRLGEVRGVEPAGDDHYRCRVLPHDEAGRLEAVHARHLDVHGDHVRAQLLCQPDGLVATGRLADDLQAGVPAEEGSEQPPGHLGVVDHQDPDHQMSRAIVSSSRSWSKAPLTM